MSGACTSRQIRWLCVSFRGNPEMARQRASMVIGRPCERLKGCSVAPVLANSISYNRPWLAGTDAIRSIETSRVHHGAGRRGGGVAARRTRRFDTTEHNLRSTSVSRPLAARLTRLLHARSGSVSSAAAKVFPIPAFSFQGSDSAPGVILAKQRPKFPTALREPLAKPLLKQDR